MGQSLSLALRTETSSEHEDAYRATLDALDVDADTRCRVVDAAVDSFELNRRVFADLGAARVPEHAAAGGPA